MAVDRFDLSFAGELIPGADPAVVRARLAALFKLTEQGVERLFSGRSVIIKRDVDTATKVRFEQAFERAGGVLQAARVEAPAPPASSVVAPTLTARASDRAAIPKDAPTLALGSQEGYLEPQPVVNLDAFDTSGLSLVTEPGWTLADCEPPPTPIPLPDIDDLSLVENAPTPPLRDPAE
ncbi:MAG: hypothetical protein EOM91_02050 [Sphingobacteriia bacterium]|nr:hypothetical protein [Sphingobacteriia bacterium]NCC38499.1 hypothetical protein [Gammaproteobacteria bacterium]